MIRHAFRYLVVLGLALGLLTSCGLRRKKYENPITKDTKQPDKVLFDKAINDVEHSRYEIARLTLQTLINTYDTSEYLAKAKLAIADSWYREGGSHGLAQAEAEYKDFILFYPTMEEAAEAQEKVCDIHYKQMEKADRDPMHAFRANEECKQLLVQFPNSKFAPSVQQKVRDIQEVLAEHEFRAGMFYYKKGSYPAAINRLQAVADQYPLYSGADEALWEMGDSYTRLGDKFEEKSATAYTRIVRDYPLSEHAEEAKDRLKAMNRPVPQPDPVAYARMKFELDNREALGMMSHFWGIFKKSPDMHAAAKSGTPQMQTMQPTTPISVPPAAVTAGEATPGSVTGDVTVAPVTDSSALDNNPDARQKPPAASAEAPQAPGTAPAGTSPAQGIAPANGTSPAPPQASAPQPAGPGGMVAPAPLPTNHPMPQVKGGKKAKKEKKKKNEPAAAPASTAPAATQPK